MTKAGVPRSTRLRVLLVDDDAVLLSTTAAILADDYEVTPATTGAEALALIDRKRFDVVCSDYNMPNMSGLDLLRRMKESSETIGFVLVTGKKDYFKEKGAERPDGWEFHAILIKPYDPQELIEAIDRAAKVVEMRRAVSKTAGPSRTGARGAPAAEGALARRRGEGPISPADKVIEMLAEGLGRRRAQALIDVQLARRSVARAQASRAVMLEILDELGKTAGDVGLQSRVVAARAVSALAP